MSTRRRFLAGLGALAAPGLAAPQAAGKVAQVGLVSIGTDPAKPTNWQPFHDVLRALGYIEGKNVVFRRAFTAGDGSVFCAGAAGRPAHLRRRHSRPDASRHEPLTKRMLERRVPEPAPGAGLRPGHIGN